MTLLKISVLSCAMALSACDKIPGTDQYVAAGAEKVAASKVPDPSSVQFRDVNVLHHQYVCGELNAKNILGAYVGFSRFVAEPDGQSWHVAFDTNYDASQAEDADRLCKTIRSPGFYCAAGAAIACQASARHQMNKLAHDYFAVQWHEECK